MSNVVPGKFANAEMVSRIRADVLLEWLLPRRGYFEGRGVRLVPQIDCAKLAEVLRDPTPDMPLELLEALYAFRGLDKEVGMDALMEEAKRRGLDLGLGPDATPLDVVVRAWSRDRQLVELVRARHAVRRGRSFQYFTTDASPVPEFTGPTADQLRLIEEGLEPFYVANPRLSSPSATPVAALVTYTMFVRSTTTGTMFVSTSSLVNTPTTGAWVQPTSCW